MRDEVKNIQRNENNQNQTKVEVIVIDAVAILFVGDEAIRLNGKGGGSKTEFILMIDKCWTR